MVFIKEIYFFLTIQAHLILQYNMGGDSFQGTERLTNNQYVHLVNEILQLLNGLYKRAESYIPMPEKMTHGDIDFLMILNQGVNLKTIVQKLNIQKYIINNNNTMNTVYKNKQVDFCIELSDQDFQLMKFYKSYGGIGSYLGLFLPSKQIKLSDKGLFAIGYKQHIKFQYLILDSVQEILRFYGLAYETYAAGFENRKSLFEYMRGCRFLNQKKFTSGTYEHSTKLTKFFREYLIEQNDIKDFAKTVFENPFSETLKEYNREEDFQKSFEKVIKEFERKQALNKKFNATHLMEQFKLKPKQMNSLKSQFRSKFKDEDQYFDFVEKYSLEEILQKFADTLHISKPKQEKEEKGQEAKQSNNQKDTNQ